MAASGDRYLMTSSLPVIDEMARAGPRGLGKLLARRPEVNWLSAMGDLAEAKDAPAMAYANEADPPLSKKA